MGGKVVTIIEAHGWGGGGVVRSQPTGRKRRSGQLTSHESLSFARVFKPCQFKHSKECKAFKQKKWKSWIEYSFELNWVPCTRREPRLTDSNTEPSSPLPPPAPERTNTNRSLNIQTEKMWKSPIQHQRAVFCAHRTHAWGTRLKAILCLITKFASSCYFTDIFTIMSK